MKRKPAPDQSPAKTDADFSEKEIARRRDETIKRMIATPPKTHKGDAKRDGKRKRKSKQPA